MAQELAKILVADDEPDICWALECALCSMGFAVITTPRARDVLQMLADESFVVVFLDAKMPRISGIELAGQIRCQSPLTKVILISGYYYERDEIVVEALRHGLIDGFIGKPFDLETIRSMARKALASVEERADDV